MARQGCLSCGSPYRWYLAFGVGIVVILVILVIIVVVVVIIVVIVIIVIIVIVVIVSVGWLYSHKNSSRGESRRDPPGERGNRGKMANEAGDVGDEDGGIPRLVP
jgi:hypothetical protein